MNLMAVDNLKQIYHYDFPDCHRSFIRQDLCARHKERHTARGSQFLRKDTFNFNPIVSATMSESASQASFTVFIMAMTFGVIMVTHEGSRCPEDPTASSSRSLRTLKYSWTY